MHREKTSDLPTIWYSRWTISTVDSGRDMDTVPSEKTLFNAEEDFSERPQGRPRETALRRGSPSIGKASKLLVAVAALTAVAVTGCHDSPSGPSPSTTTLRVAFLGPTTRRSDLPPSAQACVAGVGATHIHPSWRAFAAIPLQAIPPDRYEITLSDVPVGTRVSFRINDQNSCDENPTGAVTRNVFANDVRLIQNATTPGNGDEPGYALTVAPNGTVTQ